jgi:hypothetical protein
MPSPQHQQTPAQGHGQPVKDQKQSSTRGSSQTGMTPKQLPPNHGYDQASLERKRAIIQKKLEDERKAKVKVSSFHCSVALG